MIDIDKIDDVIKFKQNILIYSVDDREKIIKAYEYAKDKHSNQVRKSREPYITHPVNVANILIGINADSDTICAGLLHDVIEDTNTSKEEIADYFNNYIADLVDGVTKIADQEKVATQWKVISALDSDVRIVIIKLADRLHNMMTLSFKSKESQQRIALETLKIYVPLSYLIGSYKLKSQLEDFSLMYLDSEAYKRCEEIRKRQELEMLPGGLFHQMVKSLGQKFNEKGMRRIFIPRIKNIYGIYTRLESGISIPQMHDLLSMRIIVPDVDDCYSALGYVHSIYKLNNDFFKDYICNPKTNLYQAIHSALYLPGKMVLVRIMSEDMLVIADRGLTAKWNLNSEMAKKELQEFLRQTCRGAKAFSEIDAMYQSDDERISHFCSEVLTPNKIYVHTPYGEFVELPLGSTPVDLAYVIDQKLGDHIVSAKINNEIKVSPNYQLKSGDCVKIITGSDLSTVSEANAYTTGAKMRILKRNNLTSQY